MFYFRIGIILELFFFIVLFETLQMFFKRGVFDYNDIILNIIGVIIISVIKRLTEVIKHGKV